MTVQKLSRFLASCERFFFSSETPETQPSPAGRLDAEAVESVLSERQLTRRIEPFAGFASPPGRF